MEELTKKYEGLVRLHDSANKTLEYFDKENKRLNAVIQLLLQEKEQWIQSKQKWNEMVAKTVTDNNSKIGEVNDEIQRLRKENTILKEKLKKYE